VLHSVLTCLPHPVTTLHDAAAGVRFRIVSSEAVDSGNPYVRLFYQALAESGIASNGVFQARRGWLDDHEGEFPSGSFDMTRAGLDGSTVSGVGGACAALSGG
jgi:hypothetical protein